MREYKGMVFNNRIGRKALSLTLVASMVFTGVTGVGEDVFATVLDQPTQVTEASSETSEGTSEAQTTTEATTQTTAADGSTTAPDSASVEEARKQKEAATASKKQVQAVLDTLNEIKDGLEASIVELDLTITKMTAEITELEMEQKKLEQSLKETQESLDMAKKAEQEQYSTMKKRIQMVYESGDKSYLDVLLSATSMTDVMNKSEYAQKVSEYDYNLLNELQTTRGEIAALKLKLDTDIANNQSLQAKITNEKNNLEEKVGEKKEQVEEYNASISEQEAVLAKYNAAISEAESVIRAAEMATYGTSMVTFTGGPFTWPVPSSRTISSPFGERTSPVAGASTNHKGIDIECSTGDAILAAYSGTVIVATYNYAEGNYVVIDHGGGVVTLYMHNSALLVSVGDTVTAGQQIAAAGSTGVSTGPHCHFGVRVNGQYVNPMGYF